MRLRSYQSEALLSSKDKFQQGINRQLICLPTGTGKTCVFSALPKHHGIDKRTMVLVHREELASQAKDKFLKWNTDFKVDVEMGDLYASNDSDVVVASVQSIGGKNSPRLQRFPKDKFGCIICDEAHHSIAQSYLNVFDHFGLLDEDNLETLLLGVTATSNRGDGQGLGKVYQEVVYQMTILDAIKDGWLADVRGIKVKTNTSLEDVHTRVGTSLSMNYRVRSTTTSATTL
jgi:ATP-dependent helicase IRC3